MQPLPDMPTSVAALLWAGFVGLLGVVWYLWRLLARERDKREKDLREALQKEKADNAAQQALLKEQSEVLAEIRTLLKRRGR